MRAISAVQGLAILVGVACLATGQQAGPSLLKANFSRLPVYFIENRDVYPDEVAFYVQGADKTLYFTRNGITFRLKGRDRARVVKLDFVGADPDVRPRGEDRRPAVFSYFKGPEKDWKTGLRTFARVVYDELWPGVDLVYTGAAGRLKYDFIVAPGADPGRIRVRYRGATSVRTTRSGALRVETPERSFEDAPPVAWQEIEGRRVRVAAAYSLRENGELGFDLGDHDRTRPLVLDPAILVYCGFIGGANPDSGSGIAVDAAGNAYVTGTTRSDQTSFPVKVGPDPSYNGAGSDAFVAKVNANGTGLVYCGYIGGASMFDDAGGGIAVDASGAAYVTGSTPSDERTFPVKVGPDLTFNGGGSDGFVAKVNPQGTALVYCGYIGGSGHDTGDAIAVDAAGNVHVTGFTNSTQQTFPVKTGPDLTHNGNGDAFVAKVDTSGAALVHCGYIGGSGNDRGYDIDVDAAGNAYVTGGTDSTEQTFPVKVGPDLTLNSRLTIDAFVAKVNAQATALVYCGYIGGSGFDLGHGIAVDAAGNAYVVGETESNEQTFPVKVGPDLTFNGGTTPLQGDAFVAKVNAQGNALAYCGYIGGNHHDQGYGIAVDAAGNAYVTGETRSTEQTFPVNGGPILKYTGGSPYGDAFVARVNARGDTIVYCGYIGGSLPDPSRSIVVDAAGNAYVAGMTQSDEKSFPVKAGPGHSSGGLGDAFVAKISLTLLRGGGAPRPGGTVSLILTATNDAGLPYQVGSSLGAGPTPIGKRKLDLSLDNLLLVTVNNYWPSVFSAYRGVIDSKGRGQAAIHIPNVPALIGSRLHSAFITLDPAAPSGIRSISNTFTFSVTK